MSERSLTTVTVTFNPDLDLLDAQMRALPTNSIKIVVDNASETNSVERIESLLEKFEHTRLIRNGQNAGLAAAINQGAAAAANQQTTARFLLLLDQDSKPRPGSIRTLIDTYIELEKQSRNVGCVGPLLHDPTTGLTHGFHQCIHWRWQRIYPTEGQGAPVPCANLNGSGTLVSLGYFQQMGGLDESLFIDHVDTEWAFRVLASGYSLWGDAKAVFEHSMGEDRVRFWLFGWRIWPVRSPKRHYYLYRNALLLIRQGYVPLVWKFWAAIKLGLTCLVMAATGPQRSQQLLCMARGLRDGFRPAQRHTP